MRGCCCRWSGRGCEPVAWSKGETNRRRWGGSVEWRRCVRCGTRAARCANRTRPPLRSLAAEGAIASGRAEYPRSHSCPTHSSRAAGPPALVTRAGSLAAMRRNVVVHPMHQVGASHERSARLPSGTWSRVGMGMGMRQRAGEMGCTPGHSVAALIVVAARQATLASQR